jgi:predicted RNA-binding Zn-ribbon protein involved in translation (DUF1610 family)
MLEGLGKLLAFFRCGRKLVPRSETCRKTQRPLRSSTNG